MSGQSPTNAHGARTASMLLAAHALSRNVDAIEGTTLARLRAFVFDTMSVGVAGIGSPYAPAVLGFARQGFSGSEACVWGYGQRLSRQRAAFCNAFLAHCQEFDCVHEAAVLHPFTVVAPVLIAEAEAVELSGADFWAGLCAGVDIAAGIGVAATSPIKFFRPAIYGLFGATAALCRARRLSEETTTHAFGYALAFASGTMQAHSEGTPALAIQIANAARCAFDAVDLAIAGLPAPLGAVDGAHGLLSLFETTHDLSRLLEPLRDVARVDEVSWKPYPTGRAAHGGLDMLHAAYLKGIRGDEVTEVEVIAPPLISHLVGRPITAPLEVNYARLCLPFLGAVMLRRGQLDLHDFGPKALNDAATHELAGRIRVSVNDVTDPAAFTPQRARIVLRSGAVHEETVTTLPGAAQRPLTMEQQSQKAARCFTFAFGEAGVARAAKLSALIMQNEGAIPWADWIGCVSP